MTTTAISGDPSPGPSHMLAAEVRAEVARQGSNASALALRIGVSRTWVSRRISPKRDVDMTLEDVERIAEALGVTAQRLVTASRWLPRLDSNQQPSD